MYHCLTSVVQVARIDRPAAVLSTRIARWSWVSSAYWWYRTPWDAMTSATGLQYTANSSGPSTDPCGTPTSRVVSEDRCCPSFTNCVWSCRYDWIQDSAVPDTPNSVCSHFVSVEWQTVSKTAERWRPISNVTSYSQPQCERCQGHRAVPSRSNVFACRQTAACWSSWSWLRWRRRRASTAFEHLRDCQ